jgi:hypothetical protein
VDVGLTIIRPDQERNMTRYCPEGDGAFDDTMDTCPECGSALADTPPAGKSALNGDDIVWLVTAPNEPEAQMWADTLRSAGIRVFVRAGGPGVGAWASAASFEHELLVHARDLGEARRLVRELLVAPVAASSRPRKAAPIVNPVRKG